jgi:uncharacterized membrane protein YwaF
MKRDRHAEYSQQHFLGIALTTITIVGTFLLAVSVPRVRASTRVRRSALPPPLCMRIAIQTGSEFLTRQCAVLV